MVVLPASKATPLLILLRMLWNILDLVAISSFSIWFFYQNIYKFCHNLTIFLYNSQMWLPLAAYFLDLWVVEVVYMGPIWNDKYSEWHNSQNLTQLNDYFLFPGNFSFGSFTRFKSHTIVDFVENAVEHSRSGRYLFFLNRRLPNGPMRVQLLHPVSRVKKVQSLQHMCR